jgi:2-polyprenyl-6-methoxyphenol hydroxylase-like FAD-dependent oxidoreductase
MLTSNVALALRRVGLDGAVIDPGLVLERIIHADPSGKTVEAIHDLGPANERYAPNIGITRDGTRAAFDLVVGADGIRSAVRKLIYSDIEHVYRSFCAWRTVMECSDYDPEFRLSSTAGCTLGSFPVGPDLMYAFLLAHCAEIPALSREGRLARFKELAAIFHGNVSPLLAQGTAMAIEDAVALAELLGESGDMDLVLAAYEKRRRPRVETIRATVRHRTVARGLEGPATPEMLGQQRPVLSASLKVYHEMIDDPFARL